MRGKRRMRIPVPPPEQNRARVNERIRVPQVLLIDETGEKVGVTPTEEARRKAEAANLDLVEVAANARPPVCRIMDYGRFYSNSRRKSVPRVNVINIKSRKKFVFVRVQTLAI